MALRDILAGGAAIAIRINDDGVQRQLMRVERQFKQFTARMNMLGTSMMAGGAGAVGAGFGMVMPINQAIQKFAEFDQQMRFTRAAMGSSIEDFERLSDAALKVARNLPVSAAEVGRTMVVMGRAGLDQKEIEDSVDSVVKLSLILGEDIPQSFRRAIQAHNAMNDGLVDFNTTMDQLVAITNNAPTTLDELGFSFQQLGSVARTFHTDLAEAGALIDTLRQNGLSAEQAGTSLRNAFNKLASESNQAKLEELGVAVADDNEQLLTMTEIMKGLSEATENMTELELSRTLEDIFGEKARIGAQTLLNNMDDLDELLTKIRKDSERAVERNWFGISAGAAMKLQLIFSNIDTALTNIGRTFEKEIQNGADAIVLAIQAMERFLVNNSALVKIVAGIGGALMAGGFASILGGAALFLTSGVINSVGTIIGAIASIGPALGALSTLLIGPMGAVSGALVVGAPIAAFAALTAALTALFVSFSDLSILVDSVTQALGRFSETTEAMNRARERFADDPGVIKELDEIEARLKKSNFGRAFGDLMEGFAEWYLSAIKGMWGYVFDQVKKAFRPGYIFSSPFGIFGLLRTALGLGSSQMQRRADVMRTNALGMTTIAGMDINQAMAQRRQEQLARGGVTGGGVSGIMGTLAARGGVQGAITTYMRDIAQSSADTALYSKQLLELLQKYYGAQGMPVPYMRFQ